MSEIRHRIIRTNGINMRIAESGEGPLVLMLHGFPESWYSWRHQLRALADAGYYAVAPDVRGYGHSDKPEAIEAYSTRQMVADAVGILDALRHRTAVITGHDWGAHTAWTSAVLHPDRFRAVVAMSVPYMARPPAPPTTLFKTRFGERFFYILYFQEPGKAEAELERDVRRSMKVLLWSASGDAAGTKTGSEGAAKGPGLLDGMTEPETLPPWLTDADLDYYAGEFKRSGFRGPMNRYRNMDRDFEELQELTNAKVIQPALFIAGDKDVTMAVHPAGIDTMKRLVPNIKLTLLRGAGHWVQQERSNDVNREMITFLDGLS